MSVSELHGWRRVSDSEFAKDGHLNFDHHWFIDPHWGCDNGHLSVRVLKSEALARDACLSCRAPVFGVVADA